ncbi:porin [Thalassotalea euphylliae]|uniref:Porin n=1 Tax=Thalassotalea euphylliae TaxID=1655234 RepID=A0A3E0TYU4_9GAMM|nr:porin [Thalassotalea euphylliae]REL29826.1 porin [Thalassotalea euphylliae]
MKKALLSSVLCTLLSANAAQAEVSFNGFANIVAGQASSGDTLWGYDDDVDFKQGSLFALQASSDLGEGLSATAQIIARGEDDWEADFEWAYLAYSLNDNTRILAGRQRTPIYMLSDYLDVSYAYPWISPPNGVYDFEITRFDGISAIHSFTLGEFDSSIHAIYGSNSEDLVVSGVEVTDTQIENIYGAALTFNNDWLTLRGGYFTANLSFSLPILDPLRNSWTNAGFEQVVADLTLDDDRGEFLEFGVQIDYNNWLFIAEYVDNTYEGTPLGDEESMFATIGYRFNDVLVHLTYGKDEETPATVTNGVPSGVVPELDQLVGVTNQVLAAQREDSSYYTLGARWDFHDSAAFKVEFTRFDDDLLNQDTSLVRTALVTVF